MSPVEEEVFNHDRDKKMSSQNLPLRKLERIPPIAVSNVRRGQWERYVQRKRDLNEMIEDGIDPNLFEEGLLLIEGRLLRWLNEVFLEETILPEYHACRLVDGYWDGVRARK
jgi:hypothetical protein